MARGVPRRRPRALGPLLQAAGQAARAAAVPSNCVEARRRQPPLVITVYVDNTYMWRALLELLAELLFGARLLDPHRLQIRTKGVDRAHAASSKGRGLKAFVDAAADLNMSVAIDIVWNHAAGDSVLVNYDTPSDGTNCHDAKGECGTYFAHGAPEMITPKSKNIQT